MPNHTTMNTLEGKQKEAIKDFWDATEKKQDMGLSEGEEYLNNFISSLVADSYRAGEEAERNKIKQVIDDAVADDLTLSRTVIKINDALHPEFPPHA